jgi:hypothetical protein
MTQQTKQRPFVVTILAVLAGIVGVLSVIHALQGLGILPFLIGPFNATVRTFDLWYAFMWGLMAWVYFWLAQMLWRVDRQAWLFMAVITVFNLILDFTTLLTGGATTTFSDVSVSFILNALILIYVMLPGTKRAFDVA